MHASKKFLKYYTEYYDKIYRYIFFRSYENEDLAKDLTSETFLKAFEKFDSYDPEKGFSPWIYAIARNCVIDYFRKHKGKETDLEEAESVEDRGRTPDQTEYNFKQDALLKEVNKLPENARELILLKYFNDYSNKEIEAITGLNSATLRTRLHRAIKLLRTKVPATLLVLLLFVSY
jgi:RNA polymerase sigma-70 factor (ECF subfamily)